MHNWEKILSEQLSPDAKRLSVEDATILYEEADTNDLMYVSLERRKRQVPGNLVTYLVDRNINYTCLLYTSPSPRDQRGSRMPSSA